MLLSDTDIMKYIESGDIIVDPLGTNAIQPASIDVRLGTYFLRNNGVSEFRSLLWRHVDLVFRTLIYPGDFILAPVFERVVLSNKIAASIHGRSSVGRRGLAIHCTAGFVDPGWDGILTLEISNISTVPIPLYALMGIAQLRFDLLSSPSTRVYGSKGLNSHYQGATVAQPDLMNSIH